MNKLENKAKASKLNKEKIKSEPLIDKVKSLYELCEERNSLEIVCDWDEVVMSHEPYALWMAFDKRDELEKAYPAFDDFFKNFWSKESCPIEYSPFGAKLIDWKELKEKQKLEEYKKYSVPSVDPGLLEKQMKVKNSLHFYQLATFLDIARDLLKLLKEGRVKRLIFLTAYDKRKFPEEDSRKRTMFRAVFGEHLNCSMVMVGFDGDTKGADKAGWIRDDKKGFDIVIDDNPNICKSIIALPFPFKELKWEVKRKENLKVCSPYYPATEKLHDPAVILLKNELASVPPSFDEPEKLRQKYLQNIGETEYRMLDPIKIAWTGLSKFISDYKIDKKATYKEKVEQLRELSVDDKTPEKDKGDMKWILERLDKVASCDLCHKEIDWEKQEALAHAKSNSARHSDCHKKAEENNKK